MAQRSKRLPAMQETWVRSLSWEDPLETEMATHSSILAWRISWTQEPGGLQSMGLQRVRHNLETNTICETVDEDLEGMQMWKAAWTCSLCPSLLCRDFMDLCACSVTKFTVPLSGVFYWWLGSFSSYNFKSFVTCSEKSFQITPLKVDSPCTYFCNHKNNMYM